MLKVNRWREVSRSSIRIPNVLTNIRKIIEKLILIQVRLIIIKGCRRRKGHLDTWRPRCRKITLGQRVR